MKSGKFIPKRFQLSKISQQVLKSGHPWLFRTKMSSAAKVFIDGQWLKLVDSRNQIAGYGIYQSEGLIGVRVLKRGADPPDLFWVRSSLKNVLELRTHLRKYSDSFRVVHGENDGFPGVVLDLYGGTHLVLQTYCDAVDSFGRYLAEMVGKELGVKSILWKFPSRRKAVQERSHFRYLLGKDSGPVKVREGKHSYYVGLGEGQKSGAFLDLRGLRKWLGACKLGGKRVLNLFSYTGTLGMVCSQAGAREVWNVDVSEGALRFGKRFHSTEGRQKWICQNVFEWTGTLSPEEKFNLIIADPPAMASGVSQVSTALKAYRKLYGKVLQHLFPGGTLVSCCCTSRIKRGVFENEMVKATRGSLKLVANLRPEDDHPVGFPEGDYLKILVFSGV